MINGANTKSSEHDRPHAYVTRSACLLHTIMLFAVDVWLA